MSPVRRDFDPTIFANAKIGDRFCADCGWPVVFVCCNDAFTSHKDAANWDWWLYCSNKGCKNSDGEGIFQNRPKWVLSVPNRPDLEQSDTSVAPVPTSVSRYNQLLVMEADPGIARIDLCLNEDTHRNNITAKQLIEDILPMNFEDIDEDELQKMKDTDKIWSIRVYYVGSSGGPDYGECAATLNGVIDAVTPDRTV